MPNDFKEDKGHEIMYCKIDAYLIKKNGHPVGRFGCFWAPHNMMFIAIWSHDTTMVTVNNETVRIVELFAANLHLDKIYI